MNNITDRIQTGTIGELLVQLRLLEHNVQAAPPLKDTGNDLIAVRGCVFRAIQVKTTTRLQFEKPDEATDYHVLAVVHLRSNEETVLLDDSSIYLIPRERVDENPASIARLGEYKMTAAHVTALFSETA
ncbi:hypothetical protein ACFLR0_02325 [Candidatus Bipolaricaulota bacterium]